MESIARLLTLYVQSPSTMERDRNRMGPIAGFPHQPTRSPPTGATHWPPDDEE
jgi:hypothetical protein